MKKIKIMDIQEKAKAYAESKGLEMLIAAFEQAYKDGYEEGFRAAENSKVNEVIDGVEYVDLGLPSGTKWAADYLKDEKNVNKLLPYNEAEKLNIPTQEQYDELLKFCKVEEIRTHFVGTSFTVLEGCSLLGPNGKLIKLLNKYIKKNELSSLDGYFFWIKNEEVPEDNILNCAALNHINRKQFSGYGLPVLLVK